MNAWLIRSRRAWDRFWYYAGFAMEATESLGLIDGRSNHQRLYRYHRIAAVTIHVDDYLTRLCVNNCW